MSQNRHIGLFTRFDNAEQALCLFINRGSSISPVWGLFSIASRLGNGVFWYTLMLLLPVLHGAVGIRAAVQMGFASVVGVLLYRYLKHRLLRERPFISYPAIHCGTPPLDRYSFPSGHTLHAVSFTVVACHHFPELTVMLTPFTLLVAGSRVVLGLHYPSDVLAGAGLGAVIALTTLWLFAF